MNQAKPFNGLDDKSRMNREIHVRICESLGGEIPLGYSTPVDVLFLLYPYGRSAIQNALDMGDQIAAYHILGLLQIGRDSQKTADDAAPGIGNSHQRGHLGTRLMNLEEPDNFFGADMSINLEIDQQKVKFVLRDQFKGILAIGRGLHFIAMLRQIILESVADKIALVQDKNPLTHFESPAGSRMIKVLPPGGLSTSILP